MPNDASVHWLVSISMPKGDYTAGVDPRWIESHIVLASAPPAGATVSFAEGTPLELINLVADQARAAGSGEVSVIEEPWPRTPMG